ncbi:Endosialin Tumor endothelial marker 1 [Triplophysa tibetana]|uniref:Endosialin Tumor endothelial marker 1 n=1 Tax=Triplophysa tibetana TaxID=1572043 RepID=A0A5A9PPE8_9TELE|nr:Endosialin Tumor endothelial marker 1 [Triplophysa tibetana]
MLYLSRYSIFPFMNINFCYTIVVEYARRDRGSRPNLRQRDALCSEDGCYVLYFQRKIFLDAWRSCKELGGDLATIRQTKEEEMVERLFSNVELGPNHRGKVQIWIGLQRQPRQCAPTRPLRGFSWVTGDQDTQYTNWLQDDSANSCSSPHCVVISYSTAPHDQGNNLKWKDRTCSISVDGYLCKYTFRGMCTSIASEGGGNTLYSTPFNLLSTVLTHVPFGSVATVPCPDKEDQSVVCMQKKDGTFDWNSDPPVCSVAPKSSWCDQDNGGCHQLCIEDRAHYYCDCNDGFLLAEDGVSCFLSDPCKESPCEFECLPVMDSYRCACPDGSMLAPDEHHCIDLDECLQRPCEQICVNAPGTFKCRCREGYQLDEDGVCEDMDECVDNPCEHACENTFGSYICHCRLGYAPLQEDQSRCCDIDECQIEGNCEQMCINYEGGFACYCEEGYNLQLDQYSCTPIGENLENPTTTESNPWITRSPIWEPEDSIHPWNPANESDWREYLYWQTETDNIKIPTDILLLTLTTEKEAEKTTPIETPPEFNNAGSSNTNTEVTNVFFSPTISTLTQNYNEEESTTVPTVSPYYTFAGGARNWLRFTCSWMLNFTIQLFKWKTLGQCAIYLFFLPKHMAKKLVPHQPPFLPRHWLRIGIPSITKQAPPGGWLGRAAFPLRPGYHVDLHLAVNYSVRTFHAFSSKDETIPISTIFLPTGRRWPLQRIPD